MEQKQVPVLVASAGLTDIVVETLRMHGLFLENVTVRANTMHFGRDGKLERFRESSPVHSRCVRSGKSSGWWGAVRCGVVYGVVTRHDDAGFDLISAAVGCGARLSFFSCLFLHPPHVSGGLSLSLSSLSAVVSLSAAYGGLLVEIPGDPCACICMICTCS